MFLIDSLNQQQCIKFLLSAKHHYPTMSKAMPTSQGLSSRNQWFLSGGLILTAGVSPFPGNVERRGADIWCTCLSHFIKVLGSNPCCFHQCASWKAVGYGSGPWVSETHMGEPDGVPDSSLWPGTALHTASIWKVNLRMDNLGLFLYFSLTSFQIKWKIKVLFCFCFMKESVFSP